VVRVSRARPGRRVLEARVGRWVLQGSQEPQDQQGPSVSRVNQDLRGRVERLEPMDNLVRSDQPGQSVYRVTMDNQGVPELQDQPVSQGPPGPTVSLEAQGTAVQRVQRDH